ncbi:MAG: nucleotidyltransferase domain-containing protein [Melioribacteraceae bacterium]|nr:nucleotidyltransferase domain-containing protein [Melioribacteraceae bacterium]MCF8356280.1 nucleotidyltransferase domain-containing protein [Melioribacteraceae bacterium]MCF8394248.1 nucleotidyltransferase domain-containing protein [Melioribacteraceae bacterium]MCF8419969.1 nucleotidyltransferase domain-containing protein [Melioribacteraceae bacterium]
MIINKVLDQVFSRRTSIIVLRALKNYSSGISGREVARISGMAPKNSINTLTHLEDLGLVNRIRGGREHLFSLNRKNYLIQNSILPLLQSEDDFEQSLKKEIKSVLKGKVVSSIIFGSVVRKEETEESDLDLCLIYDTSKNLKKLEEIINNLSTKVYQKYGVSLSPLYISKKDFIAKARKGQSPVKQIIKEGELIVGDPVKRIINA